MTDLGQWAKLLHVVGAFMLVAGLIGRELTRQQARHTDDIRLFTVLTELAGRFERLLVIPGSNVILLLGLAVAWLRGWPLFGFLQGAHQNWLLVSFLLTLGMIPLIVFVFLPRGKLFELALSTAQARQEVTAELRASMDDPVVRLAHIVEATIVGVVIYLMVMKPF